MHRIILSVILLLASGTTLAASAVQQLQQLITEGQYSNAVETGEALLQQAPGDARTGFLTAYAYQMNSQTDKAINLYETLIKDNPDLPEPRNNLAMIYIEKGNYDRASELLIGAINTHPSYATAYNNLSRVYRGIASEAYRRAVSESSEPAKYSHDIKLTALTALDSFPATAAIAENTPEPTLVNVANRETQLIEIVQNWSQAWSKKDLAAYIGFYSSQHRAKFDTHERWVAHRRDRIMRPGEINIEVSDIVIKWLRDNRAVIDFKQSFDSPRYSDRVVKRLGISRIGEQWKITEERVLSVL